MMTSSLQGQRIAFLAGMLQQGGAERQLYRIVSCLRDHDVPVSVLTLAEGVWEGPLRDLQVPVIHVGAAPSRMRRVKEIIRVLREQQATIVQAQHFYANAYVALAARVLGIRGIGAIRNDGIVEMEANGFPWGWLHLYAPRRIAANSHSGMDFAIAHGRSPARVLYIPNVVDPVFLEPLLPQPHEGVHVLGVGRLTQQKRYDLFVQVIAGVDRLMPGVVRGTIVGAGRVGDDTTREIQALAERTLPSPGLLRFCNETTNIRAFYREADILLLCSDHEGTPNVVLEAMASGLPVIATNVGAVPEIIQDGVNGVIVPRGDTGAMIRALAALAADPAQRAAIGARARETVQRTFTSANLYAHLERLYTWGPAVGSGMKTRP